MGAQHSSVGTVGRTKSLDEYQSQNNGSQPCTSSSGQLRSKDTDFINNQTGRDQKSKSTLVIVHRPSLSDPSFPGHGRVEDDPLFKKVDQLPMFVPLMHEVETGSKLFSGSRNRALQEIRSKIHLTPFIHIVHLYEDRLKRNADSLNVEQGRLSKCVREVDMDVAGIFKTLIERQKKFAKHADNLKKMNDLTHALNKCQTILRDCERNLQILNGFLSASDRLEAFSWNDMFEDSSSNSVIATTSSDAHHQVSKLSKDTIKNNLVESDESVEVAVEQGES